MSRGRWLLVGPLALALAACPGGPSGADGGPDTTRGDAGRDGALDAGLRCGAGQVVCGGACVDTATDRANCGACDRACAAGQVCAAGACVLSCPQGSTACGGLCVDARTDNANCGACGRACGPGQACAAGACAATCAPPLVACGAPAACTDTATDVAHCGACGNSCATAHATPACAAGACAVAACAAGFLDCDGVAGNGCEVDGASDPANCGACGRACAGCTGGECPRRVFFTAGTRNGSFGGLAGADGICQGEADMAHLAGTFRAWLSDATGSPSTRFTHSAAPYVRVDGAVVATSWTDLTTNGIRATLTLTAAGADAGAATAWTNTLGDGTATSTTSCTDWTSATVFGGGFGQNNLANAWTNLGAVTCASSAHLYCFEQ